MLAGLGVRLGGCRRLTGCWVRVDKIDEPPRWQRTATGQRLRVAVSVERHGNERRVWRRLHGVEGACSGCSWRGAG